MHQLIVLVFLPSFLPPFILPSLYLFFLSFFPPSLSPSFPSSLPSIYPPFFPHVLSMGKLEVYRDLESGNLFCNLSSLEEPLPQIKLRVLKLGFADFEELPWVSGFEFWWCSCLWVAPDPVRNLLPRPKMTMTNLLIHQVGLEGASLWAVIHPLSE